MEACPAHIWNGPLRPLLRLVASSIAFATLCLALPATASSGQTGHALTFGDWAAACDNGWRCEALLVNPLAHQNPSEPMRIVRLAGPDGLLQLSFFSGAAEPDGKSFQPDMVEIGGGGFDYLNSLPDPAGFNGDQLDFEGEAAMSLLRNMAQGDTVRLIKKNGPSVTLSTRGLMGVLVHFDTVQQRIGNESAAYAKGPSPATTTPPPPELPIIKLANASAKPPRMLRKAQIIKERATFGCGEHTPFAKTTDGVDYYRLDENTTLAQVIPLCSLSNYNSFVRVLLIDEKGKHRIAPIEGDNSDAGNLGENLVSGYWDAERRRLVSFGFWRAGCGSGTEYGWDGERFRIVEERRTASCDLEIFSQFAVWRAMTVVSDNR